MTQVSGIFEHNKTNYFSLENYALVFWAWKTSTVLFYFFLQKFMPLILRKNHDEIAPTHPQTSQSEFWQLIYASEWGCVGASLEILEILPLLSSLI